MHNKHLFFLIMLVSINKNSKVNIKFNVKDENNQVIRGALIRIKPYNSRQLMNIKTCCHGSALLRGVFKNIYEITICKKGYKEKKFLIKACKNINCNICLCHYNDNRIYGYITDFKNEAVENAIVVLYRVICENVYVPEKFTYTDFSGEYNFFDILGGKYIVKAIK